MSLENLVDGLVNRIGLPNEEIQGTKESIVKAIKENKFQYIKDIGFFSWREIYKYGTRHIYIENLFILPEERKSSNLLWIRDWFRKKYPNGIRFFYWDNQKKNKFTYYT